MTVNPTLSASENPKEDVKSLKMMWREAIAGHFRLAPVVIALIAIWIYFSFQSPAFLTPRNLNFLALQVSVTALLALALSFVLIVAEIDLSIAVQSAVSAAVGGNLMVTYGVNVFVAALAAVAVAVSIGVFHAFVINRFKLASFIVTLGTMIFLQGVLIQLMPADSRSINLVGTDLADMATRYLDLRQSSLALVIMLALFLAFRIRSARVTRQLGEQVSTLYAVVLPAVLLASAGAAVILVFNAYRGVPWFTMLVLIVYTLGAFIMGKTKIGAHIYAVGGNPEAARRAGINVARTKLITFMLTSTFCAIAGLVAGARVYGVSFNSGGSSDMLNGVAACIIGGIALAGGRGSIWGILVGAVLMASVSNGLFLNSAPDYVQFMIQGMILVGALTIDAVLTGSQRR